MVYELGQKRRLHRLLASSRTQDARQQPFARLPTDSCWPLTAQRVRAAAAAGRIEVQEAGAGSPSWVSWRRGRLGVGACGLPGGFPVSRKDVYDGIRQACEPCSRLRHAQSPARLKVSGGVRMRRVGAHGSLDGACTGSERKSSHISPLRLHQSPLVRICDVSFAQE